MAEPSTAAAIAAFVRNGEYTAREAVSSCLRRIASVEDSVHAFSTLDAQTALVQAATIDARIAAGDAIGPLAGVPIAVKDLIVTRGLKTTFGSPLYADYVPDEDDVSVERLKEAGAIVIGKTNCSEFGYGPVGHNALFPTTCNPWNPALTPGGSSAGTAAAVAARAVPVGLGSDGGGSIRIPAALCGIVGMKASWGRVPLHPGCRDESLPGASGWESLEHIGPLALTVADLALVLSVIAGPSSRDRHSLPSEPGAFAIAPLESLRGARIAYSADLGFASVEPETRDIAARAAHGFARAFGCEIVETNPILGDPQRDFEALVALDTDRVGLRRLAAEKGHRFEGPLAQLLATSWTADDFTAAILARKRIANTMSRFMTQFDLLLTPTTAAAAFPIETQGPSGWTPFTALANLTGQPAASVPAGFTADGRPVGLQIVGRHLADSRVLTACAAFEAVFPWAHVLPIIAAPTRSSRSV